MNDLQITSGSTITSGTIFLAFGSSTEVPASVRVSPSFAFSFLVSGAGAAIAGVVKRAFGKFGLQKLRCSETRHVYQYLGSFKWFKQM